jgi:hypothetical protein
MPYINQQLLNVNSNPNFITKLFLSAIFPNNPNAAFFVIGISHVCAVRPRRYLHRNPVIPFCQISSSIQVRQ